MIFAAIAAAAAVIIACGFLGAPAVGPQQAASFVSGALTLGGALVICALFAIKSRWHGIGGACVVALAGCARNLPAVFAVVQASLGGPPHPPGEPQRAIMAVACLALFLLTGRKLLSERQRRQQNSSDPAAQSS